MDSDPKLLYAFAVEKSIIRKRYVHLTEEMMKQNPNISTYMASSPNKRRDIMPEEVPKPGAKVASAAIKEWGSAQSKTAHLVFYTTSCVQMPGADYQLTNLLDLSPSVMLYLQGCY